MVDIIGQWKFPDNSFGRLQKTFRKARPKIVIQTLKKGQWKTYQVVSEHHLEQILKNIEKKGGIKIR